MLECAPGPETSYLWQLPGVFDAEGAAERVMSGLMGAWFKKRSLVQDLPVQYHADAKAR